MNTRSRNEPATVFVSTGVHTDVEIELHLATEDGEQAWIQFGRNEGLTIDFADVDSLERLSVVAAEGARLLQARIEENRTAARAARKRREADLVGAGAA